jgi:hypothetical protein
MVSQNDIPYPFYASFFGGQIHTDADHVELEISALFPPSLREIGADHTSDLPQFAFMDILFWDVGIGSISAIRKINAFYLDEVRHAVLESYDVYLTPFLQIIPCYYFVSVCFQEPACDVLSDISL